MSNTESTERPPLPQDMTHNLGAMFLKRQNKSMRVESVCLVLDSPLSVMSKKSYKILQPVLGLNVDVPKQNSPEDSKYAMVKLDGERDFTRLAIFVTVMEPLAFSSEIADSRYVGTKVDGGSFIFHVIDEKDQKIELGYRFGFGRDLEVLLSDSINKRFGNMGEGEIDKELEPARRHLAEEQRKKEQAEREQAEKKQEQEVPEKRQALENLREEEEE